MIKMRSAFLVFFLLPLLLQAQKDTAKDIDKLLNLSLEELMNIKVVTASGYLQKINEAPSTITVVTAKQIQDRGYEQLEDALRDIPGIDMIHLNGYAPTLIYFRGMYGAENLRALLMVDGIVENNILGSNDMAGPVYSLHNVERIEIIWGPASALYGANAFGGVINIITRRGGDINGLQVEQGFGTFNTSFEKISAGMKKDKWELDAAGTLYSTDGPKFSNRDPNYNASYVSKAFSINSRISYISSKSKTTLGFRMYKTPMGFGTFFNSPTVFLGLPSQGNGNTGVLGLLARDVRGEKSGRETPYLRTIYVQNNYQPNEKFDLQSRIVYRETGIGDDSYAYLTLDGSKLIRAIITSSSSEISGQLAANYHASPNGKLSAGIEFSRGNVERGGREATLDTSHVYLIDGKDTVTNLYSTFLPRIYDIRVNFGSYLQYVLKTRLLKKTNFTAGIRYDYNSYFGNAVSPRLAVVNQPSEQLTLKFQFGTAFRAPTNLEIYQAPPELQLKTEKIKTYELNAMYSFSKNVHMRLNLFRNELTDIILISNLSGLNENKNPGEQQVNGVETGSEMILAKNVRFFVNLTYMNTMFKNLVTGKSAEIAGVAKWKANAGATVNIQDMFVVTLTGNWVGKRPVPSTDPYGPVSGYLLTNVVISSREFLDKKITVSLNIHNLFNTKWLDPGFRTADGFLFSTVLEQPGVNGIFKVGLKL